MGVPMHIVPPWAGLCTPRGCRSEVLTLGPAPCPASGISAFRNLRIYIHEFWKTLSLYSLNIVSAPFVSSFPCSSPIKCLKYLLVSSMILIFLPFWTLVWKVSFPLFHLYLKFFLSEQHDFQQCFFCPWLVFFSIWYFRHRELNYS